MRKGFLLWKPVMVVVLLLAIPQWSVSGPCGSFDAFLIGGSVARPPGSFPPCNGLCGGLLMASLK
jgi:hypothetical protein